MASVVCLLCTPSSEVSGCSSLPSALLLHPPRRRRRPRRSSGTVALRCGAVRCEADQHNAQRARSDEGQRRQLDAHKPEERRAREAGPRTVSVHRGIRQRGGAHRGTEGGRRGGVDAR